jgi:hypothetical protein
VVIVMDALFAMLVGALQNVYSMKKGDYFRFRGLTCEERVTGLFDCGPELPPCSRCLFLLFPEGSQ